MSASPTVNVVVALAVEAKPIVAAWQLRRVDSGPFTIYQGEVPGPRHPARLIVTGVGRTAAAAGVAWLAAHQEGPLNRTVWINYGVGGAARIGDKDATVGDVVLATTIVDEERRRAIEAGPAAEKTEQTEQTEKPEKPEKTEKTEKTEQAGLAPAVARGLHRIPTWYPPWIASGAMPAPLRDLARSPVRTVDRPELAYQEEGVFEMEAAGFIETALRFSSAEFVQVMKVVSDTPTKGIVTLDAALIAKCSGEGVAVLNAVAQHLADLHEALPRAASANFVRWVEASIADLRLTVAQSHQWRGQLTRLVALGGDDCGNGGEAFARTELEKLEITDRRTAVATLESAIDRLAVKARKQAASAEEASP